MPCYDSRTSESYHEAELQKLNVRLDSATLVACWAMNEISPASDPSALPGWVAEWWEDHQDDDLKTLADSPD